MNAFGFVRICCSTPRTVVADPQANAAEILRMLDAQRDVDVSLFPELCVTAYTCADLFGQPALLDAGIRETLRIAEATVGRPGLVVVGLPVPVGNSLYNAAVAISGGEILGIVPKQYLPNYKEYYEARWFAAGNGREPAEISFGGRRVPFGIDLLFEADGGLVVGVEICEDLWMPVAPSALQALAGANVLLNLSASNEIIGKGEYRRDLVVSQSGRCIAAYAYTSAGPSESTTDLVFSGHALIAENGRLFGESRRVGDGGTIPRESQQLTCDIDLEKLQTDRRGTGSFDDFSRGLPHFRRIAFSAAKEMAGLKRPVSGTPFVPRDDGELKARCAEIFEIQCAGLAKRIEQLPEGSTLNIGVSGGLDSTLALLVAGKTCDVLGRPRSIIHGLTMPGFGTTARTKANAVVLMRELGVTGDSVDVRPLALRTFIDLRHSPFGIDCRDMSVEELQDALHRVPKEDRHDLVFENVQARLRTFMLMSRGFVIGTGDLSEQALGWSTYNGDHMSMYNPNTSIPKTLVKFLVEYAARHEFGEGLVRDTLLSIAATTISPELLPTDAAGESGQSTEDTLGPYELHDFFLFYAIRYGYPPEKLLFLSEHATFTRAFSRATVETTLATFYRRFFSQQFKRSCVPDGPKVGTVSLSPRGDWRMPSDASAAAWLRWRTT